MQLFGAFELRCNSFKGMAHTKLVLFVRDARNRNYLGKTFGLPQNISSCKDTAPGSGVGRSSNEVSVLSPALHKKNMHNGMIPPYLNATSYSTSAQETDRNWHSSREEEEGETRTEMPRSYPGLEPGYSTLWKGCSGDEREGRRKRWDRSGDAHTH